MAAVPFRIDVPDIVLDDLKTRLARARIAAGLPDAGWSHGTDPVYLASLCDYWHREFDWRKQEAWLNSFSHFRASVGDVGLHFIHERGKGTRTIPLLLIHGWPDSFARFLKLIPLLTDPASHGAEDAPCFDVVVPSLPGFAYSDRPKKEGMIFDCAGLFHRLMTEELGYERFAVQGGDWGGIVAEQMARSYGSSLIGLHMTDVPFMHAFQAPGDLSHAERAYLAHMEAFPRGEGGYASIQSTRPQSLAQGLNDSPAGLAAWMIEKFRAWSDCGGDLENSFSRDEILTNIMIYWTTQTIDSSFFPYFDIANAGAVRWIKEMVKGWLGNKDVPTSFALFPKDLSSPPREWAERFFNVVRWTEMPRGGHFAAMEEPELLAEDIRAAFAPA